MSKEKTPQQKKASSLKHDRRNTYGESAQASRKNIARAKQRSHQRERHAVAQELNSLAVGPTDEELALATENSVKTAEPLLKAKGVKTVPDDSLGQVLKGRHDREKPFQRRLMDSNLGRPEEPPVRPKPKLRSRIMYIECKAESVTGPACIGRVFFSKRGGTLYYGSRSFQSLKGSGFKANYCDTETLEHYWISGPRKDGNDRLYAGDHRYRSTTTFGTSIGRRYESACHHVRTERRSRKLPKWRRPYSYVLKTMTMPAVRAPSSEDLCRVGAMKGFIPSAIAVPAKRRVAAALGGVSALATSLSRRK